MKTKYTFRRSVSKADKVEKQLKYFQITLFIPYFTLVYHNWFTCPVPSDLKRASTTLKHYNHYTAKLKTAPNTELNENLNLHQEMLLGKPYKISV
jgi:hypothetical protein